MDKFVITFAGVPGTSKTPTAYYLSWNLGLPILNNDAMRTEVREDVLAFDEEEYIRRRDERIEAVLKSGIAFIYDASVDRSWEYFEKKLRDNGYGHYVIDMELSRGFVRTLYKAKEYDQPRFDGLFAEHEAFLERFGDAIDLKVTDTDFENRLAIALENVREWIRRR